MIKDILKELIQIRKELQDIKLILKFKCLYNYEIERKKVNGETIRIRHIRPDPLEELRKEERTLQQCRRNGYRS